MTDEDDDVEDFAKLSQRSLFENRLQTLEANNNEVAPRQLATLLRAMVLGKREKLKEFQPRVLALHKRVRGGTKLDGTAVLAALSYIGNLEATYAEYERLRAENIKSFELNYGYLIEVSSSQGNLKQAFSVVDLMRRDRDLLVESRPSTFVFNRLIIACGRNQSLGRAYRAFELMHEEGLRPTPTTFAAYIDACARTGDLQSGLKVLSQMKRILRLSPEKYQLDASYYTGLIPACHQPQDFDRIVAEMIREDIAPAEETLAALIKDCATNGGLSRALGMFKELRLFQEVTQQQQSQKKDHKQARAELAEERRKVVHKPSLGSIFF
jgi:pentatricopeptide repeat protein